MRASRRRMISALGVLVACGAVHASQPSFNYSDKTVAELLQLLGSPNAKIRQCAAIFIGDRYSNPNLPVVNGPVHKPKSPAPELPIPAEVMPRLAEHLKSDPDVGVRICVVSALRDLRFRTDTAATLSAGLDDKDVLIRIRTCAAFIEISHEYSEPLHAKVIPTMIQCLAPDGDVENLWQAAYASESLGAAGKSVIPALKELTKHKSPKVREYAQRALSKIEEAENKSTDRVEPGRK